MINRITDNQFKLVSKYQPSGDQPQAIEQLVDNIEGGEKAQQILELRRIDILAQMNDNPKYPTVLPIQYFLVYVLAIFYPYLF